MPHSTPGLFSAPPSFRPRLEATLHFDGSAIPNPGPNCRCGFVLVIGQRRIERSIFLGQGTCNTVEYAGIINGMQAALDEGVTHLRVFGDSLLVIRGVSRMRLWKKGKPHLELLKKQAQDLARRFDDISFQWVPRERNGEADALSVSSRPPMKERRLRA